MKALMSENHLLLLLVILLAASICSGHSATGRHSGHSHYKPKKDDANKNLLKEKEYLKDYEHIREDLQELYNKDFADKLVESEMEGFYFQLHDLNQDKLLDGLELLAAMNHVAFDEDDGPDEELEKSPDLRQSLQNWWNEKFEEHSEFVDQILKDEDLDQDGFISYFEFSLGRQKERGEI